jgi:GT2 family glycosyltransferase
MKIAAVVTHFNQNDLLIECLTSLAMQVRLPDQIIIVDDNSSSPILLSEAEDLFPRQVTLIQNSTNHGGPAIPRNQGISACSCSHLVFVDADDMLFPQAIQAMQSVWLEHPSSIAYGDQFSYGTAKRKPIYQSALRRAPRNQEKNLYKQMLKHGNQIFFSGSGGPTALFQDFHFDQNQQWEDYDLWLRLAKNGQQFTHTRHLHTLYRIQNGSRSGSRQARHAGCRGIKEKHLSSQPIWSLPLWYWRQRYL